MGVTGLRLTHSTGVGIVNKCFKRSFELGREVRVTRGGDSIVFNGMGAIGMLWFVVLLAGRGVFVAGWFEPLMILVSVVDCKRF